MISAQNEPAELVNSECCKIRTYPESAFQTLAGLGWQTKTPRRKPTKQLLERISHYRLPIDERTQSLWVLSSPSMATAFQLELSSHMPEVNRVVETGHMFGYVTGDDEHGFDECAFVWLASAIERQHPSVVKAEDSGVLRVNIQ